MRRYFECDCGHRSFVDSTQVGRQITCLCGKQLTVPSLGRLIREERPPDLPPPLPVKQRVAGPAQGLVYASLLSLIVFAVAIKMDIDILRVLFRKDAPKPLLGWSKEEFVMIRLFLSLQLSRRSSSSGARSV